MNSCHEFGVERTARSRGSSDDAHALKSATTEARVIEGKFHSGKSELDAPIDPTGSLAKVGLPLVAFDHGGTRDWERISPGPLGLERTDAASALTRCLEVRMPSRAKRRHDTHPGDDRSPHLASLPAHWMYQWIAMISPEQPRVQEIAAASRALYQVEGGATVAVCNGPRSGGDRWVPAIGAAVPGEVRAAERLRRIGEVASHSVELRAHAA